MNFLINNHCLVLLKNQLTSSNSWPTQQKHFLSLVASNPYLNLIPSAPSSFTHKLAHSIKLTPLSSTHFKLIKMASKTTNISLLVLIVALFWSSTATAQTSCTTTLMALSPCLNYVTGNSSSPSSSCCSQLSNVVSSQPQCLCLLLNGTASSYGININQTLALQLPSACSVQTPSTSRCNGER